MKRLAEASCKPMLFVQCPAPVNGNCLECPYRGLSVVYGPFPSRRRGFSLGINVFPCIKLCSFNCVYCFRGPTQLKVSAPIEEYGVDPNTLQNALEEAFTQLSSIKITAIDFSGNGEPTLHINLPELINTVRKFVTEWGMDTSIGIFTNSSMLDRDRVVKAITKLDHVEAKLDTVIEWKFKRLNLPSKGITVDRIVKGLKSLRKVYRGKLAIQIMLFRYGATINYSVRDAALMAHALSEIEPDIVHLYTVYRKPRLAKVYKAPLNALEEYARILREHGLHVEVYT